MGEKCPKCAEDVLTKDGVKCSDCSTMSHVRCAGTVARNKKWKCENCAVESISNSSKTSETGTGAVLEAIAAFRRENNDKLDLVHSEITGIKSEIADLKIQFDSVKGDCAKVYEEVSCLQEENKRIRGELVAVQQRVADLEQHTRKNNIIISGVPVSNQEDMLSLLNSCANALQVNFYASDISAAHRLQGKRGDPRPPPIVVCFTSRLVKASWLSARGRKGKLSAKELARSFPDTPIYLNEHLTPQTRAIFNSARELLKQKKLSSVWTRDCKVMAKLSPQHRPILIRDMDHIADLGQSALQDQPAGSTPSQTNLNISPPK